MESTLQGQLFSLVDESVSTFLTDVIATKYNISPEECLTLWKDFTQQPLGTSQRAPSILVKATTTPETKSPAPETKSPAPETKSPTSKTTTTTTTTATTKTNTDPPVPPQFSCPILGTLMIDPVVTSDGHTYERLAILHWLKDHNTSPLTMKKLDHPNVVPNHTIRAQIIDFREAHGLPEAEIWKPPAPDPTSTPSQPNRNQINIQINRNNSSNSNNNNNSRGAPIWNERQTQQLRELLVHVLQTRPHLLMDSGIEQHRQRGMPWLQCADLILRSRPLMQMFESAIRSFEPGQTLMRLHDQRQQAVREEQQRQVRARETPPMRALRNDDAASLLNMVSTGTCIPHQVVPNTGQNMLHAAARMGKSRCVAMLLARFFISGVGEQASNEEKLRSIDAKDINGSTALHLSCFFGKASVVKLLLAAHANVNMHMRQGDTPLIQACWNGHLDVIDELLAKEGIELNATKDDGCTALQLSTVRHQHEVIKRLLARGRGSTLANGETMAQTMSTWVNMSGDNALHIAASVGCTHATESLLLTNEGDVQHYAIPMILHRNQQGMAPIHIAVHHGNELVVKLLIECIYNGTHPGSIDADGNLIEVDVLKLGPDYPTANQDLPLHIAAQRGFLNTCKLLLDAGANVNSQHPTTLMTPLHCAAQKAKGGSQVHRDILELLGKYDAKDLTNANGLTPLCLAATSPDGLHSVRTLIEMGMHVNPTGTRDGVTPLMKACSVVSVHAAHGNGRPNNRDVMAPIVKRLLDAGADVNAQMTTSKNTALHLAASRGSLQLCQALMEKGADATLKDRGGLTAIDVAQRNRYREVVVFIQGFDGGDEWVPVE
jgi:ankyrin repeat protein